MMKCVLVVVAVCSIIGCRVAGKQVAVSQSMTKGADTVSVSTVKKTATPSGVAVDVRGVALDTDGDGVPDYRDIEKLTLQKCFPVNEDGLGVCPEPECCKKGVPVAEDFGCHLDTMRIRFEPNIHTLSLPDRKLLKSFATLLKSNPNCEVRVGTIGLNTKPSLKLSLNRVNAVIQYLVAEEGISKDRINHGYNLEEKDTVVIVAH